ncbi:hypothetical protein ACLB2K_010245 [Fragaria x ananassa]
MKSYLASLRGESDHHALHVPNLTIKTPPAQQLPQVHLIEESSEIQRKRKRESEEVQCGLFHHFAPLFFSVSAG